jgi:type I restriction enzyme S subunit
MAVKTIIYSTEAIRENRFSAEFFDPKYTFTPKDESQWIRIGRTLRECRYGISISMNEKNIGYPIFRMNELENCFATTPRKFANISEKEYQVFRLKEKDVLFNRTNSFEFVGRTGIIYENIDAVFASYLLKVVPDTNILLPEYLTIYLNTKFGEGQIKRRAMRSINQANVSASELKKVFIYLPEMSEQKAISKLVERSFEKRKLSHLLYVQAQKLLEEELGMDQLVINYSPYSVSSFVNVSISHRLDAQYFQSKFTALMDHLSKFHCEKIKDIRIYNSRGIQPNYVENGSIDVVNSQHIGKTHLKYESFQKTSERFFRKTPEGHIQENDLLIYTTGAYIGQTNVFLKNTSALASNHVNILRIRPDIDPVYMGLIFQSKIGKYQTEKHSRGSAQAELYPSDIDKFLVPILPLEIQKKIGELVRNSLVAENESNQLLEQAKKRVEDLIEGVIE